MVWFYRYGCLLSCPQLLINTDAMVICGAQASTCEWGGCSRGATELGECPFRGQVTSEEPLAGQEELG